MKRFLLSIIITGCFAFQAHSKKPPTTTLYLSLPDQIVKCQVISEKCELAPKETLTYYWYAHNAVFNTQGGFDGRILHGSYRTFYLNNQLKESGQFDKGLKNKTWTRWNEQGKIMEIYTWKKGVLHGLHKVYNDKGELVLEESIKNGVPDGKHLVYENGKLKESKVYDKGKEKPATPKKEKPAKAVKEKKAETSTPKEKTKKPKEKKQKDTTKTTDKKEKKPFLQKVKGWFKKDKPAKDSSSSTK
ncbi:MAG: hypothetical protein JST26_08030 [Bacteroidetes bacterium]|nr:hypothetical protein [Bacteroidota bacterium]